MPLCDMCGSKEAMVVADVEGGILNVCNDCSSFGKIKSKITGPKVDKKHQKGAETAKMHVQPEKEIIQMIVQDFARKIRDKREHLNLKQEELAKKLNEKESLLHKIEIGEFEPSIALARKLEKFLHLKLVEQHEEVKGIVPKTKSDAFTIGDFIKVGK